MRFLWHILDLLPWRAGVGARGERVARRYLHRAGYRILARNLRLRQGEIDVLCEAPDGRTLVVVEVKSRRLRALQGADTATRPEEHVNADKQRKLTALARELARCRGLADRPVRFDVIGVDLVERGPATVRHHPAAFEALG